MREREREREREFGKWKSGCNCWNYEETTFFDTMERLLKVAIGFEKIIKIKTKFEEPNPETEREGKRKM